MPASAPHPARPALSAWDVHLPAAPDDSRSAVQAWLAHLEAGRIGVNPAPADATRDRLAHAEAVLLGPRRGGIW